MMEFRQVLCFPRENPYRVLGFCLFICGWVFIVVVIGGFFLFVFC